MSETQIENSSELNNEAEGLGNDLLTVNVILPTGEKISCRSISPNENTAAVKQYLSEFKESCFYSNYGFQYTDGNAIVIVNEFVELGHYVVDNVTELEWTLFYEDYDSKKGVAALKSTREIISSPPTGSGFESVVGKEELPEQTESTAEKTQEEKDQEIAAMNEFLISQGKTLSSEADLASLFGPDGENYSALNLGDFFKETLVRGSIAETSQKTAKDTAISNDVLNAGFVHKPNEIVRGIAVSGWNPPPADRVVRGDLLYAEVYISNYSATGTQQQQRVPCSSSTLYITVVAGGFFINKCTSKYFDPSPAEVDESHPYGNCFSHDLFFTIYQACPSFKRAWDFHVVNGGDKSSSGGAYGLIKNVYDSGRGDLLCASGISWLSGYNTTGSTSNHLYSMSRAQENLCDSCGLEEKGVNRDWNEEIQSIRSLPDSTIPEKLVKYRYHYKLSFDFTEACKQGAIGIASGNIVAFNPMDEYKTRVYVYNNIFFSRAYDTKESVRLFSGDEASRKYALHEYKNQKMLYSLGIEGVTSTLCTIVDYRGERFVCQTIVPGVLQANKASARLMFGLMDPESRLSVKKPALEVMEKLMDSLHLVKRTVSSRPLATKPASENEEISHVIRVDLDDEVSTGDNVTIVGPLEGKILLGSDERMYACEMVRLTPRDANYVKVDRNGTGNVDNNLLNQHFSDSELSLCSSYVLRSELINRYLSQQVAEKKHSVVNRYLESTKAKDHSNGEEKDEPVPPAVLAEMEAITVKSIGLELNVNCYTSENRNLADVDAKIVAKDEEVIKMLSNYLFNNVISEVSEQIRKGDIVAQDNEHMVSLLHNYGVNMRYLGELASRAVKAEEEDAVRLKKDLEGIKANEECVGETKGYYMPAYWLEFLEIEVMARSVKHVLNEMLRNSSNTVKNSPAALVALLLNAATALSGNENHTEALDVKVQNLSIAGKKGNKKIQTKGVAKKADKGDVSGKGLVIPVTSFVVNELPDSLNGVDSLSVARKLLHDQAWIRFGCKFRLFSVENGIADSSRVSVATLLRRICQVCGIRLALRNYNSNDHCVINIADVVALNPMVKSAELDVAFPDSQQLLEVARSAMRQQNFPQAYELSIQAAQWLRQVVGNVHKDYLSATAQIASILVRAGSDHIHAYSVLLSCIALSAQLKGFDNTDVLRCHMQLAGIYQAKDDYVSAVNHMLAAKYIVNLCGGFHHAQQLSVLAKLGELYCYVGAWEIGLKCYEKVKLITEKSEPGRHVVVCADLASLMARLGMYPAAAELQKESFLYAKYFHDKKGERVTSIKSSLETYIRISNEQRKMHQAYYAERERELAVANLHAEEAIEVEDKKNSKKKSKKTAKK